MSHSSSSPAPEVAAAFDPATHTISYVVADPATGAQQYYEGHTDDIVCVALHPNGQLVATGQGASAGGAAAELHVWDVRTRAAVGRVGRVLDERVGDGVTTRPFYPGSLCAAAFGPDGRLLVGVGKDEQHTHSP